MHFLPDALHDLKQFAISFPSQVDLVCDVEEPDCVELAEVGLVLLGETVLLGLVGVVLVVVDEVLVGTVDPPIFCLQPYVRGLKLTNEHRIFFFVQ